jgi:hypothetical protein
MKTKLTILILLALLAAACEPTQTVAETQEPGVPEGQEQQPAATEPPPTEPPTESPTETPFDLQPAAGQRIEFEAEDGAKLVGYYYPAIIPNAPVIVLMHWAGGTQVDWIEVGLVQWLQNRPDENPIPEGQKAVYPPMPPGLSFAVFTFDFRDFGESQSFPGISFSDLAAGWVMDAKAAYKTAKEMTGVDPSQAAGLGSSIGADGVVDACSDAACQGAFSLSPGGYLGIPYDTAVTNLANEEWIAIPEPGEQTAPIFCAASEQDIPSADACKSVTKDPYRYIIFPGELHGTLLLIAPGNPPDIGQLILDWLEFIFGIPQ